MVRLQNAVARLLPGWWSSQISPMLDFQFIQVQFKAEVFSPQRSGLHGLGSEHLKNQLLSYEWASSLKKYPEAPYNSPPIAVGIRGDGLSKAI